MVTEYNKKENAKIYSGQNRINTNPILINAIPFGIHESINDDYYN